MDWMPRCGWAGVGRHLRGASVVLALAMLAAGCARTSQLPVLIGDEGQPVTFQRIERQPQRDWRYHFTRTAYREPGMFFRPAPGQQSMIVDEWGRPDFTRRLRSMHNEPVVEWVYLDPAMLYQFVKGELVHEGPLSDREQLLLLRGRPDRVELTRSEMGDTREIFIYFDPLQRRLDHFWMVNGRLVQSTEGN